MSDICFSSSSLTGANNLCRSTIKMRSFSLYSHALSSSEPKLLRMWDQTSEGMSIRFIASGFPIYKKIQLWNSKYFETNGHKIDAPYKINVDRKPTTIDDQHIAIKRIDDNKKLITHLSKHTSLWIVHKGNEGYAIQVYQLPAKITFTWMIQWVNHPMQCFILH
jgi:hypothetical protein